MRASSSKLVLSCRSVPLRPAAAALGGVMLLAACTTWVRRAEEPSSLLASSQMRELRVTRRGGGQFLLRFPFITGDSLGGTLVHSATESTRITIPLRDVQSLEVRQFSKGRTIALAAALGATVALVVSATRDEPPPPPPPPTSGPTSFSCPLVYSWDGVRWRLDSGTFGGAIMRALQRTDVDNLDYAVPRDGTLRLRVANELAETDHLDALAVLAVDHEAGVSVAPDPAGRLHTIGALAAPVRATDGRGTDALARVRDADGWNWESSLSGRDPARDADVRDGLELAFVRPPGARRAHLVLDGNNTPWSSYLLGSFVAAHGRATQAWYDSLNAEPALARATGMRLAREGFLAASVRTASGWRPQGMFWEAGPEVVKRQVLDLDLTQVEGDTVHLRLESAPAFWLVDRVALDFTADRDLAVHELRPVSARDRAGRDVAPLIAAADDRYYVLEPGDAAELRFRVPEPPAGTSRTLLLRSTGWYRIHTPAVGEPDVATLDAVARAPLGLSRASVVRLNAALARLTERTQ